MASVCCGSAGQQTDMGGENRTLCMVHGEICGVYAVSLWYVHGEDCNVSMFFMVRFVPYSMCSWWCVDGEVFCVFMVRFLVG